MKAWKRGTLVLFMAGITMAAGCSSSDSPKEVLLDAMAKTNAAKTFTYKGTFTINDVRLPQMPGSATNKDAMLMAALPALLKGAVIQVHGVVQQDPQHAELTLDATLGTGDVKITLSIPIIVAADKIYVKVPEFPGLGISEGVAGRFAVIDAKKLAEEQGGSSVPGDGETLKLGQDAARALFDSLDERTYLSEPKAADVKGVPDDHKADRYIRMNIDSRQADEALTAIAGKAIPQVIELLLKNEAYRKTLQLSEEQLDAAKDALTAEKLKETVTLRTFDITGGITDDYLTYESGTIQAESTDAAKGMKLDVHFDLFQSDINKKVKFEYELPKDAVPVDRLGQLVP
ncbi:hypothetical protein [Paenibacillus glycinis]|uniref:Lipoprotein n=1 Tax=Paenibacillus glycinis TaxID=2697035 RepID=A0ABW9XYA7_9BACL|nr:hypothetical protein [Paenibacillus glycinis]NBD27221.1 hypothetical protein [Paenibacillus glycinis]